MSTSFALSFGVIREVIRGNVEEDVVKEGSVTINAKKLYEIIREVPNEQVQLKRLENDWVEIRAWKPECLSNHRAGA